jgi:predicted neutral ceramidase superfamily lipid hydrolase
MTMSSSWRDSVSNMDFRSRMLLRVFCVWTLFVWIVLVKNMLTDKDHSIAFRSIHIGLAVVSIGLALAVWPRRHSVSK